jgi:hypothetical protein
VVDLPFFSDYVDRRRQVLVQDSTGTSPGRRATMIGALLHAPGIFIDSQSLIGDGVFLDLAMVEARLSSGVRRRGARVGRRPLA